jgi:hypothetical protein
MTGAAALALMRPAASEAQQTVATFADVGGAGHYDYQKATLTLPVAIGTNGSALANNATNSAIQAYFSVVHDSDIAVAFRGCTASTGAGTVVLKFAPGLGTNDFAFKTWSWTLDTTGWVAGSTNWATTNLTVASAAGSVVGNATRYLELTTLGNASGSALSAVKVDVGVNPRLRGQTVNPFHP